MGVGSPHHAKFRLLRGWGEGGPRGSCSLDAGRREKRGQTNRGYSWVKTSQPWGGGASFTGSPYLVGGGGRYLFWGLWVEYYESVAEGPKMIVKRRLGRARTVASPSGRFWKNRHFYIGPLPSPDPPEAGPGFAYPRKSSTVAQAVALKKRIQRGEPHQPNWMWNMDP